MNKNKAQKAPEKVPSKTPPKNAPAQNSSQSKNNVQKAVKQIDLGGQEYFPNLAKLQQQDIKTFNLDLNKCKEVYDFFERKGKNQLPKLQLGYALRSMGYLVSTLEVRELCVKLEKNNSGFIEFKDFLVAIMCVQNKQPNEKELLTALKIFDKSNNGIIDKEELKGVLIKIGDIITEKEFDEVVDKVPQESKGKLNLSDLMKQLLIVPNK